MRLVREIVLISGPRRAVVSFLIQPGTVTISAVEVDQAQARQLASEILSVAEAVRLLKELEAVGDIPACAVSLLAAEKICSLCGKPLRPRAALAEDGKGGFRHCQGFPDCIEKPV